MNLFKNGFCQGNPWLPTVIGQTVSVRFLYGFCTVSVRFLLYLPGVLKSRARGWLALAGWLPRSGTGADSLAVRWLAGVGPLALSRWLALAKPGSALALFLKPVALSCGFTSLVARVEDLVLEAFCC